VSGSDGDQAEVVGHQAEAPTVDGEQSAALEHVERFLERVRCGGDLRSAREFYQGGADVGGAVLARTE